LEFTVSSALLWPEIAVMRRFTALSGERSKICSNKLPSLSVLIRVVIVRAALHHEPMLISQEFQAAVELFFARIRFANILDVD
jgi:hypothetical protein